MSTADLPPAYRRTRGRALTPTDKGRFRPFARSARRRTRRPAGWPPTASSSRWWCVAAQDSRDGASRATNADSISPWSACSRSPVGPRRRERHGPVGLGEVPRRLRPSPTNRRIRAGVEQREVEPAALPVVGAQVAGAHRPVEQVVGALRACAWSAWPGGGHRRPRARCSPARRAPRRAPAARSGPAGPRCTPPRHVLLDEALADRGSSATRGPGSRSCRGRRPRRRAG